MEKAILKTLIYANIFDYPLNIFEIHKWLINKKANLRQIEKAIKKLSLESRVKSLGEYYFLPKQDGLVNKRKRRQKQSAIYFRKAKFLAQILKIIPFIKLIGVSGGLAMENAEKKDDIDFFIIISKNKLWLSRILALGLISLTGQRRKAGDAKRKIAGKICLNILVEEDKLGQISKDIFIAHEVLQMKVLWERGGIYGKYLEDNEWAFKFLPNWVGSDTSLRALSEVEGRGNLIKKIPTSSAYGGLLGMTLENLAKKFQLWYMKSPKGMERIEDGALYFHPNDCRLEILERYREKVKKIISP